MKATPLSGIPDVLLVETPRFFDERGYFTESFRETDYPVKFVQDNISCSKRGVLRGLHYQHPNPQAKLVTCVSGIILDVAVDIRKGSPTFGKWVKVILDSSSNSLQQLYIPEGFAHGFLVLGNIAIVCYKCSNCYSPSDAHSILWNDPDIGVQWDGIPLDEIIVSKKDAQGVLLKNALVPEYNCK